MLFKSLTYLQKFFADILHTQHAHTIHHIIISLSGVNIDFKEVMFSSLSVFTVEYDMHMHPQEQTCTYNKDEKKKKKQTKEVQFP